MNIYSIEAQFVALDAMLEESNGVLTPEIETYMDSIQAKSLNYYSISRRFGISVRIMLRFAKNVQMSSQKRQRIISIGMKHIAKCR